MTYLVSALIVLGVLIIVHEVGHFLMARRMGVGVEKFSIGFGPQLWSKKVGETEYRLALAPFGGYVKMVGDEEGEAEEGAPPADPEKAFNKKPVWRRMLIVAAGPTANLLFAALVFGAIYAWGITVPDTKIKTVLKDSPAQAAGLTQGDRIVSIDGKAVEDWSHLADTISTSPGKPLKLAVDRADGTKVEITVIPAPDKAKTIFGETVAVGRIGISPDETFKRYNPVEAVALGFRKTYEVSYLTLMVIVKIFQKVVPAETIGGPLMIFKIAGDQAQAGIIPLLMFMGVLSVNLGILNFLPIPILDGGHIVFFIIEGIIRKPVSLRAREIAQQVGLFLLISLMAFAFYNDITRFIADFSKK
ncbi:MAG: RIP metalloprotease RseP [Nitrospinae bacterium]|nr:RIP metalloprotease RseP [Nitrospinota bacterium]